jgi:hypothetical protein
MIAGRANVSETLVGRWRHGFGCSRCLRQHCPSRLMVGSHARRSRSRSRLASL